MLQCRLARHIHVVSIPLRDPLLETAVGPLLLLRLAGVGALDPIVVEGGRLFVALPMDPIVDEGGRLNWYIHFALRCGSPLTRQPQQGLSYELKPAGRLRSLRVRRSSRGCPLHGAGRRPKHLRS